MKKVLPAILFLGIATGIFAQYDVTVTSIPVWVKVQDKSGNPVRGLRAEDFEVFEDGKRIQTDCFEEINLEERETQPVAVQGAAPSEPQRFVLFLDLYNTTPREYATVKPALQDFLESLAGKKVEVMLAAFLPDRRLGVISRFTNDLKRVKILLDFAKANAKRDAIQKSKNEEMQSVLVDTGEKHEANAKEAVIQEDSRIDGYQTARVLASQEVATSKSSLAALETFAENMARFDLKGHADIILVSGGFSVDPGRRFFNMAEAYSNKTGAGDHNERTQLRQTGFSFREEVEQSIGKLNRLNVTLYTLDARGMVTEPEFQDSLIQMAKETGGIPFFNSDNFSMGLERVREDIKHQYLLCYSPPEHKSLGKYHDIRVNVKRNGVSVRYRDGYWE